MKQTTGKFLGIHAMPVPSVVGSVLRRPDGIVMLPHPESDQSALVADLEALQDGFEYVIAEELGGYTEAFGSLSLVVVIGRDKLEPEFFTLRYQIEPSCPSISAFEAHYLDDSDLDGPITAQEIINWLHGNLTSNPEVREVSSRLQTDFLRLEELIPDDLERYKFRTAWMAACNANRVEEAKQELSRAIAALSQNDDDYAELEAQQKAKSE